MLADVVSVDMGSYCCYGLFGQLLYFLIDIANPKSCINQQTSLIAVYKIAVGFLLVAIFTDDICIIVNCIYGKQVAHVVLLNFIC